MRACLRATTVFFGTFSVLARNDENLVASSSNHSQDFSSTLYEPFFGSASHNTVFKGRSNKARTCFADLETSFSNNLLHIRLYYIITYKFQLLERYRCTLSKTLHTAADSAVGWPHTRPAKNTITVRRHYTIMFHSRNYIMPSGDLLTWKLKLKFVQQPVDRPNRRTCTILLHAYNPSFTKVDSNESLQNIIAPSLCLLFRHNT